MVYSFLRDFPETLKNEEFKASLEAVERDFGQEQLNESQKLQILFFLEDLNVPKISEADCETDFQLKTVPDVIRPSKSWRFKNGLCSKFASSEKIGKRSISIFFSAWIKTCFRDFILSELDTPQTKEALKQKLNSLLIHPLSFPDIFVWYFQKIIDKKSKLPFSDPDGKNRFFEGDADHSRSSGAKAPASRSGKKNFSLLTADRYKIVRDIMQHSSLEEIKNIFFCYKMRFFDRSRYQNPPLSGRSGPSLPFSPTKRKRQRH